MKRGHIFFIAGIAGAGKKTVRDELLKDKNLGLQYVLSYTTRTKREGEKEGVDYYFLTEEQFKEDVNKGDFLEYNFVHNQAYYGTKFENLINNGIEKGMNILKELDITMLPKIISSKKLDKNDYTYIFIDIPLELIKERMKARGDDISGKDYLYRIESAKNEKTLIHLADYVINGSKSKEEVYEEIKKIIELELK